jgi:MoaA/NifB/PqqE/SkfB family radical SAM enzyme
MVAFMEFLARELDVHFLHMPWVIGTCYNGTAITPTEANLDYVIADYQDAVSASLDSLKTADLGEIIVISAVDRALRRARPGGKGKRKHICPAGSGTLSVGADGKVYPCFMFTNKTEFELGRVGSADIAAFDSARSAFMKRVEIPVGENPDSFETGAACAGHNHEVSGDIGVTAAGTRRVQNEVESHIRRHVAAIQADNDLWEWMQTKFILQQVAAVAGRGATLTAGC